MHSLAAFELVEALIWIALVLFLVGCATLARWMNEFMAIRNQRKRERRNEREA